MHATIRRYDAIDQKRTNELVQKTEGSLVPRLSELPGFKGYYLIEADNGVLSSVGLFDTEAHAEESTRVETALPNPPRITSGKVLVQKTRELVAV